ncbi:uncharacterized protein LOC121256256 isoform X2 [Juglans microcarpa x Juglans regia]|uniref:uncharacterized protein LOC121256256 isoform X2 n=1 Tax=Juglans microcarpa x Juglans regia TaxID=2249226 RepID=UPI001B7DC7EC|nr:uncharacterized protein LOC121256256 isoform X2 [Juglans microcarpa x Juglans regia]
MATQAGSLIQDQNFNPRYNGASVGGKSNVLKAERKAGLGGRKPLCDLSNSGKPAPLNQATKKQSSKNLALIDEDSGVSKLRNDTNKKKGISKVIKTVLAGNRKALSDISNSGKARLNEAPKKNLKMKLSAVAEEQLHQPNAIADEQFLHNHLECIKAQTKAMDMDEFLKTVGLDNVSSKTKIESPLKKYHLDLEEMAEQVIEDGGSSWKHEDPASPPPCKTPKSVYHFTFCNDYDFINFKLMETPELPRH